MKIHIETAYLDDDAEVQFATYGDGSTAVILFSTTEGGPLSYATVCLADQGLVPEPGNVFIKDWSENAGMLKGLLDAGVIGAAINTIRVGPYDALAYECPLLMKEGTTQ